MPFDATGKWIPEDDSAVTKLNGLLASDSTYMQTARAAGTRTASRRGLLNSSIAAGAAESAAIAAGAPLASQDAQQTSQKNMAVIDGGIQLNNQTTLNDQQNAASLNLQGAQADSQMKLQVNQQESAAQTQAREFEQRTAEQTSQLSSAERQAQLAADTHLRQSQITASAQLSSQYLSAFGDLARDPNVPAATRNAYIAEFQKVLSNGQNLIGAVQSAAPTLQWGTGSTATTPGAQAAPNYAAYVQNNPDLLADFQKVSARYNGDMAAYGAYHYNTFGKNEGRRI